MPGKRRLVRMSGAPGQPRSAASEPLARASDKAPLTRAPLCVCIFFPFLSRAAPGARPPPPPPPPSASLPGADYLSRAALRVPGMPSAPKEPAIHRGAAGAGGRRAGGARGRRGARAGQNLRPRRSRRGLGLGAGGRGTRGRRGVGGERTRAASIWGESERGGEERERGRGEPEGARAVQ